jgi:uncharacterized membrane protein (UPF0127 family)
VSILILVASACGDDAPAGGVDDAVDGTTRPTDATNLSTTPDNTARDNTTTDNTTTDNTTTDNTTTDDRSSSATQPTSSGSVPGVVPQGFGTIAARVTASDGEICELCLWLADDSATRGLGLMGVTDLGGLDGMAFRYDSPHTTSFTMRNTVMPLSIVFFDADGAHLDEFDMEPCVAEPCPSHPTPTDFVVAIEVPRGGLAGLGIGPGSVLELFAEGCSST